MTMGEYLSALESGLKQLPEEERKKQVSYYKELFADMKEEGLGEEEIAEKLGSPKKAAEEIMVEMPLPLLIKSRVKPQKGWTVLTWILLILGSPIWLSIAIALLAVVLSVYVVIWSLIVVLFAVVLAILLAGAFGIVLFAVNLKVALAPSLLILGLGLICLGLTVPAFWGFIAAAKGVCRLTGQIAKWIRSLFIRKEETR